MFTLHDKTVLIMGGTGSLGTSLLNRLLSDGEINKIIIFSRDELKQHNLRLQYHNVVAATDEIIYNNFKDKVIFKIGDIRNYHSVIQALKNVDIIFNTAAIKQVPVAEYSPYEALQTNVMGVENIINAIIEYDIPVETMVGISTDKACKPINAYGMTKALMERMVISANVRYPDTRFILCRYGNVMASRGSVIPLFQDQIKSGKDLTLTHENMTRFMMNLNQAVDTVLYTYKHANPGEIYIPRIPSAKVKDVALSIIGDKKIHIKNIGIRPGEKIHEILISSEEMPQTYHKDNYYVIRPMLPELWKDISIPPDGFTYEVKDINEYASNNNLMTIGEINKLLYKEGIIS